LKPIDICKCSSTVVQPIRSLLAIEQVDSKRDLSNIAKILASRSSRGGLQVQISSWRSWRPNRTSAIQNRTVRSLQACSPNCSWSLAVIWLASIPSFQRNRMITLWSYSIINRSLTNFNIQNEKIIF
jgi:hypothetical protein